MTSTLLEYLLELGTDPLRARDFLNDPEAALTTADLTADAQGVLRSQDPAVIRAALAPPPPERDLTLLA